MSDDTPAKTDNPFPAEPDREDVIAALQARERFLAGILGGLESFFTVDSEWRCTFANEAGAGLAGVSAGELLGSDLREFIPLAVRDEVCARLGVAMSERVRTAVEDSDRRMYAAYPLADGGIAVYVRETTALDGAEAAQRHAAEALRESEERYQLLHDTMFQGVVYQEADGAIISMNPAAERILGKRAGGLPGLDLSRRGALHAARGRHVLPGSRAPRDGRPSQRTARARRAHASLQPA